MIVTQEDLVRVLDERGARLECPVCDRNEWLSMSLSGEMETLVLLTGLRSVSGEIAATVNLNWGFPVVGVYCSNCGYVRLHRLDVLGL